MKTTKNDDTNSGRNNVCRCNKTVISLGSYGWWKAYWCLDLYKVLKKIINHVFSQQLCVKSD